MNSRGIKVERRKRKGSNRFETFTAQNFPDDGKHYAHVHAPGCMPLPNVASNSEIKSTVAVELGVAPRATFDDRLARVESQNRDSSSRIIERAAILSFSCVHGRRTFFRFSSSFYERCNAPLVRRSNVERNESAYTLRVIAVTRISCDLDYDCLRSLLNHRYATRS